MHYRWSETNTNALKIGIPMITAKQFAPAINGNPMSARDKTGRQLLGEGLKAAIARRDAARAHDGDI